MDVPLSATQLKHHLPRMSPAQYQPAVECEARATACCVINYSTATFGWIQRSVQGQILKCFNAPVTVVATEEICFPPPVATWKASVGALALSSRLPAIIWWPFPRRQTDRVVSFLSHELARLVWRDWFGASFFAQRT